MKRSINPYDYLLIILPFILLSLVGVSAQSHQVEKYLDLARRSLEDGSSSIAAAHALAGAAELMPTRTSLWQSAGEQAMLAEEFSAAIEYFQKADEENSLNTEGRIQLGLSHESLGNFASAAEVWKNVLSADPKNVEALVLLANNSRAAREYPTSVEYWSQIISLQPTNGQAYYEMGLILSALNPEKAIPAFTQAAEFNPELAASARYMLEALEPASSDYEPAYVLTKSGQALATLDEWDLATTAFIHAIEDNPQYAEAWAFLGESLQQVGVDGYVELQTAYKLNPNSFTVNTLLSLYWQRQGDLEMALQVLQTPLRLNPNNAALHAEMGSLLLAFGDLNAAIEEFQEATRLNSRKPEYWIILAEVSLANNAYVEEIGLPAALEAVILSPGDPAPLTILGRIYQLLQQYSNAEENLILAVEINPSYARGHLYLGLYYFTQGDAMAAREHWLQVVTLDEEGPEGEQAKEYLALVSP